jgi:hypothetical protein
MVRMDVSLSSPDGISEFKPPSHMSHPISRRILPVVPAYFQGWPAMKENNGHALNSPLVRFVHGV